MRQVPLVALSASLHDQLRHQNNRRWQGFFVDLCFHFEFIFVPIVSVFLTTHRTFLPRQRRVYIFNILFYFTDHFTIALSQK